MSEPEAPLYIPPEIARTIVDPKAHARQTPVHEAFTWLRRNNPLGMADVPDYNPFWVATRFADIQEISRHNEIFHNSGRPGTVQPKSVEAKLADTPAYLRTVNMMDEPDHHKYRMLTQKWFLRSNVARREQRVRQIARAAVERMLAMDGRCDFVRDVALHYPLHVIMDILGVPEQDEPLMLKLTQELFGAQDDDLKRQGSDADSTQTSRAIFGDFFEYFRDLTAARRVRPADDVASVIANARIDERPLPDLETLSYYVVIATAGHDTTSSSTAGAVQALCERPDEFARVQADPGLVPGLVEEAIRWTTPVQHFMRTAVADFELRGRHIQAGDWVMLCYPSGNRDETVYDDPFVFRADRHPNPHVAFGFGAHLCLGMHLARLEMRALFEELLPRLRTLELDGEPRRSETQFIGGPKQLPIRWTLR